MAQETFYAQARAMLAQMLNETPKADQDELLDAYAEALTRLHGAAAHRLLEEVLYDAKTRLDARLAPDPVRQTLATLQTGVQTLQSGVQDLWRSLWDSGPR